MELNKEERRKDKNNKKKERERKVRKCLDHYNFHDTMVWKARVLKLQALQSS